MVDTTHLIRDEAEYEAVRAEIATLLDAAPGSPEEERLDLLTVLVEEYDARGGPMPLPDPIEAVAIRMETLGLTRADLGRMLGAGSGRVAEIMNRRRPLTLEMMRVLSRELTLGMDVLTQAYPLDVPATSRRPGRPAGKSGRSRAA